MSDKHASKTAKGYVAILGLLSDTAKRHGYALGVHGTLGRDLDLIAAPWIESASDPEALIDDLAQVSGGKVPVMFQDNVGNLLDNPVMRPHGRQGWVVHLGGGAYLDVSVMPRRDQ
jgi:hypothetical protein